MRRMLAVLITGFLIASGMLVLAANQSAQAAPTYPEFVKFTTSPILVDTPSEHVTLTVELDEPVDWTLASAKVWVCARTYTDWRGSFCRDGQGYDPYDQAWFTITSTPPKIAQRRILIFEGDVPSSYGGALIRDVLYRVDVGYKDPSGQDRGISRKNVFYTPSASRVTINGPAQIETGAALTLGGTVECYRETDYGSPLSIYEGSYFGSLGIEFRLTGTSVWKPVEAVSVDDWKDGTWSHTILAVGATGDWRTRFTSIGSGYCQDKFSQDLHVVAGSGPPPPSVDLPVAPGLSLGQVTTSTAALAWSNPGGPGSGAINGYRFGWESASGLPVPSWSQAYTLDQLQGNNPFVMTNLCSGCTYSMWVEALTPQGAGTRSTILVTTTGGAIPPTPTPTTLPPTSLPTPTPTPTAPPVPPVPPVVKVPGVPVNLHGVVKHRRGPLEKIIWKWRDPASNGGAPIKYWMSNQDTDQPRIPASVHKQVWLVGAGTVAKLKIRACNRVGCGKWAAAKVRVR